MNEKPGAPVIELPVAESAGQRRMILNMGPQHPATHGVLRLMVEIDGEVIVSVRPEIGYLHTGIEKTCEAKFYQQVVPLTDRINYLDPLSNNLCYCLAVEKLLGLEIPPRAQWIRVLLTESAASIRTSSGSVLTPWILERSLSSSTPSASAKKFSGSLKPWLANA